MFFTVVAQCGPPFRAQPVSGYSFVDFVMEECPSLSLAADMVIISAGEVEVVAPAVWDAADEHGEGFCEDDTLQCCYDIEDLFFFGPSGMQPFHLLPTLP